MELEQQPGPPGQRARSPKRPLEDPGGEEPENGLELGGEDEYAGPSTRRRAAKERKVMLAIESALEEKEFKSVCTRRPDGTVDMEPANLASMC